MADLRADERKSPGGEVAQLTPEGRGGVHVLWVREGGDWVRTHFRPRGRADLSVGRVQAGWIVSEGETLDEVLVRPRGPGETEIHCHGGRAVSERILDLAAKAGLRRVSWRDAMRSTHLGDRIQLEALTLLVEAETDGAARMLAGQAAGLLSDRIAEIGRLDAERATVAIDPLLATASFGIGAASGSEIRIVGPPNSGKSTLFNALLGWDRAIVDATAGTTRDLVRERMAFSGMPVDLVDTPGLRREGRPGEDEAIRKTDSGWAEGEAAILCLDGSVAAREGGLVERLVPGRDLLVLTKADLPGRLAGEDLAAGVEPIRLSARTGEGMASLREAIAHGLAPGGIPDPCSPVVFTRRQEDALQRARQALSEGNEEGARWLHRCRWGEDSGEKWGGTDG